MTFLPFAFIDVVPGVPELLVIFGIILLLFGPRQLPKLARALGRFLESIRSTSHELRGQVLRITDLTGSPQISRGSDRSGTATCSSGDAEQEE